MPLANLRYRRKEQARVDSRSMGLLETALAEGFENFAAAIVIEKVGGDILLVEKSVTGEFELPSSDILKQESLMGALPRIALQEAGLVLTDLGGFINHVDVGKKREFHFSAHVADGYEVQLRTGHKGYAWLEPKEALSHPVREDVMFTLDLFMKQKETELKLKSDESRF